MSTIHFKINEVSDRLYPITLTRSVADVRPGIFKIREKWDLLLTQNKTRSTDTNHKAYYDIPDDLLPTVDNYKTIAQASEDNVLLMESQEMRYLRHASDISFYAADAIIDDVRLLFSDSTATKLFSSRNTGSKDLYIHESAKIESCFFNTDEGPIVIDSGAFIMQGAMLRGPLYIGKKSIVKMGAQLYSGVSIGRNCTVGGEMKNAVFFDHSNKAHDGYLGDSVIGSWCNLGAGTTASNLKNTAGQVSYEMPDGSKYDTGRIKGGLIMGDYCRTAIQTNFNTATTVGVCCNLFDVHFKQKSIRSYTWGKEVYSFDKAILHINNWMKMRQLQLSPEQIEILERIYKSI